MSEERKAPVAPTAKELAKARTKAEKLLAKALPFVEEAQKLADKFGFNLEFLDKEYLPYHDPEVSMWMPSDDEVEGSGYLEFTWSSSNEGNWVSEADMDY